MLDPRKGNPMLESSPCIPLAVRSRSFFARARALAARSTPRRVVGLLAAGLLLGGSFAQTSVAAPLYAGVDAAVFVQINLAPPALPIYVQPPCPGPGYLWTPGYWAYAGGYYWVPGTWVLPPAIGMLWTPGYWGFVGGAYAWHAGYWGPHVGFYGGVHYGFGYNGIGFVGGRWVGRTFAYNRFVTNVNVNIIHDTYVQRVNRNVVSRVSYNGGHGGLMARPTAADRIAMREHHFQSTAVQRQHVQEAARRPELFARRNGGRPSIAATPRAGVYSGRGIERAGSARPRNMTRAHSQQPHRAQQQRRFNRPNNAQRVNRGEQQQREQQQRARQNAQYRGRAARRPQERPQARQEARPHPQQRPENRGNRGNGQGHDEHDRR
jgi:WXXGXW repeat (2 copies)